MESIKHADLTMLTNMLIRNYETNKSKRFLLGITGTPGAGKSTLANLLMRNINKVLEQEIAIVIPMDGFHYYNEILVKKNLSSLKGSPETFDSRRFVNLIKEIAMEQGERVSCPAYDRGRHNPVEHSILVENKHKIIIVEGNYLLLATSPWNELAKFFAETWFIDTPYAISHERLIRRQMKTGRKLEEVLQKIDFTDRPNAELIAQTRYRANKIIRVTELLTGRGNNSRSR